MSGWGCGSWLYLPALGVRFQCLQNARHPFPHDYVLTRPEVIPGRRVDLAALRARGLLPEPPELVIHLNATGGVEGASFARKDGAP